MERDMLELQIAVAPVRDALPKDAPLRERLEFAMRYVREHEHSIFWMTASANDDMKFRTALAAVMTGGTEGDRDIIARSVKPLRMLAAAATGIPVDFAALELADDLLPLSKMWHDSARPNAVFSREFARSANSSAGTHS